MPNTQQTSRYSRRGYAPTRGEDTHRVSVGQGIQVCTERRKTGRPPIPMVGKQFGHLVVLAESGHVYGARAYLVECSCGRTERLPGNVIRGWNGFPGYNYCKACRAEARS